jgi:hypothetical protein
MWFPGQAPFGQSPEEVLRWSQEQFLDLSRRLQMLGKIQPYTPVVSASGGGFSLGNGSIVGYYVEFGATLEVSGVLQAGSTTNFGTGQIEITVPRAGVAGVNFWGNALATDVSAALDFIGLIHLGGAVDKIHVHGHNLPVIGWTNTVPFTWANQDSLYFQVSYATE